MARSKTNNTVSRMLAKAADPILYQEWQESLRVRDGQPASDLALHEASHAVAAILLGIPTFRGVSLSLVFQKGFWSAGAARVDESVTMKCPADIFKAAIMAGAAPAYLRIKEIPEGISTEEDFKAIDISGENLIKANCLPVPIEEFRDWVLDAATELVSVDYVDAAIVETARRLDNAAKKNRTGLSPKNVASILAELKPIGAPEPGIVTELVSGRMRRGPRPSRLGVAAPLRA